jgi:hypothetical protein
MNTQMDMFGMTTEDIENQLINSPTSKMVGLEMTVMGLLSDAQYLLSLGDNEAARKLMNVSKFILGEMMEARRFQPAETPRVPEGHWDC